MGGPGSGRKKGGIIGPGRKKGQQVSLAEYSKINSRKFMKPKDIKKHNGKIRYLKKSGQ